MWDETIMIRHENQLWLTEKTTTNLWWPLSKTLNDPSAYNLNHIPIYLFSIYRHSYIYLTILIRLWTSSRLPSLNIITLRTIE